MKRIFFVAGESSGDSHGAELIRALHARAPDLQFEGLGGEAMAAAGMHLRYDLAADAIMGFSEVLKHLAPMRRLFLDTVAHLRETRPDCLVLIDYPGFNIRLAVEAAKLKIPVAYYISPQVWAWKKRRLRTLAQCVGKMLVIFPFEEQLYREHGMDVAFVGNPLLERIPPPDAREMGEMVIGILPGSRQQEIRRLLPPMLTVAEGLRARFPNARFASACVNEKRRELVELLAHDFPLEVKVGGMHDVLRRAHFCLVASGTGSLEAALYGVPMIILYRVSWPSYMLARMLVRLRHIGIANILAGREIVPEYIQHAANPSRILPKAVELIEDTPARRQMLRDLSEVRAMLGEGNASERAAEELLSFLGQHHTSPAETKAS